ncbi:MAG TPA: C4-type zinc ribbon domain-containing protein [Acidimicrobiales bacterium]|nr:C4-type zinc ribbon domain-containing protein [Acidimicrobiales bacterium]
MPSAELDALLALQEYDTTLDQVRNQRETLPERTLIHELNLRRRASEAAATELAARSESLATQEIDVESELNVVEKRVATLDATLRAPGGAGTRDAQAIVHEVDHLRERAAQLEEQGLTLLQERDDVATEQAEIAASLDGVATQASAAFAALAAAEASLDAQAAETTAARDAARAAVPVELLATYDRLRERLGGVGAARVSGGSCSGCHLALSSVDVDRLHKLAPGEFATCEQCGRILVP